MKTPRTAVETRVWIQDDVDDIILIQKHHHSVTDRVDPVVIRGLPGEREYGLAVLHHRHRQHRTCLDSSADVDVIVTLDWNGDESVVRWVNIHVYEPEVEGQRV